MRSVSSSPITPVQSALLFAGCGVYDDVVARIGSKCPGFIGVLKNWIRKKWWSGLLACMAMAAACFFSYHTWPLDHFHWEAYEAKAAAPLRTLVHDFPADDHRAKLDYRLTVPLVAHALGLERSGIRNLYLGCMWGALVLCYSLFLRSSGDRVSASLFLIAVAGIPPGSEALFGRVFFDPAALFLGVACLHVRHPAALGALLLSLSFVDERAFIMFPAIWLHQLLRLDQPRKSLKDCVWCAPTLVLVGITALHLIMRQWLTRTHGFSLPIFESWQECLWLVKNFRYSQGMMLATFEFAWLPVLAGVIAVWRDGRKFLGSLLLIALMLPLAAAVAVADVGRSMNYALPAFVTICIMVPQYFHPRFVRSLLLVVAPLNILFWNVDYIVAPRPGVPFLFELGRSWTGMNAANSMQ